MKFPLLSRMAFGLSIGVALLIGCQNSTEPDPPSSLTVTGSFTNLTASRPLPDSGVWRTNKSGRSDSGRGKITCVGTTCSQSFTLKAALGSDKLVQDLYSLGLHFATFTYTQSGSSNELTLGDKAPNSFEDKLLTSFYSAFKAKSPGAIPKASDLLAYYAELLLAGDATYVGQNLPKGMALDSARAALVRLAIAKGVPAKALTEKALLSLSADLVRTLAKALKLDTTVLFPASPVRVVQEVKVLEDLTEGEGEVAVTGAFAWDTRWTARQPEVVVKTAAGAIDDNVFAVSKVPDLTSGAWILSSNMTLRAKKGAQVGTDTLIVTVKGDSGFSATSRTTFKVLRGDVVPPKLSIREPAPGTEVPNATDKIKVVVEASDAKGIAEVSIGAVVLTEAPYEAMFDLAVGYNLIRVQAKDLAGNISRDSMIVLRAKSSTSSDITPPVVTLKTPSKDTDVVVGQPSIEISWTATDEVALKKVTLNGAEVAGEAGLYKKIVTLHDSANVFEIKAFDTTGNATTKTVTVTRPADLSKPGIVPPTDKTVESSQATISLTWKISSTQKVAKITLNGKDVAVASEISGEYDLKPGPNAFTLVVTDKSGANYTETTVITRATEVVVVHPSITALPDRSVGTDKETDTLVWGVANSGQVVTATVNDEPVTAGATIQKVVSLDPGANKFTLSLKDSSGLVVTSSTIINRAIDSTVLGITKLPDAAVGIDDSTTTLTWTVQHSSKAVSADINGAVAEVGPTISKVVSLAPGLNEFKLTLTDAKGAKVSSSVKISRAIDTALLAVSHPSDRTVTPETDSDTLTWKVSNASKALSGTLNGNPVVVGATIGARVNLVAGNNQFILVLKNAKGPDVSDTVIVARAADIAGPSIVWVAPTKSVEVDASVTTYAVQVKVTDPSGVDSVFLNGVLAKKETGDLYSTTLALPKPDGDPIKIVVLAKDARNNATRDSLTVTRKVPDGTNKPIIKLVKPTAATGNALKYEESTFHVEADITDALLAIDAKSVTIGGVAATATGSVYAADVPVPATGKATTITIKAANANGIASTLNVEVTRAVDAVKPTIAPDASTKTQSVDYGTTSIGLSWTVYDNHKVTTILYNGLSVPVAATVKQTLALKEGANRAVLVAIDSTGNKDSSEVVITRKGDATPPVVTITKPSKDTMVNYGTPSIDVTAVASDAGSGMKTLKINGTATALPASGTVSVALVAGKNVIKATATDNAEITATDSVVVTVAADDVKPTVKIVSPDNNTFLANGTTSVLVTVSASDNAGGSGLDYITVNGIKLTGTTYTVTGLKLGANTITAEAVDKAGNKASTQITVTQMDKVATPTFDPKPEAGAVAPGTVVKLKCETPSAVIKYTLGTSTTENTYDATKGITVTSDAITAWATLTNNTSSEKAVAKYTVMKPAATPTFTPPGGSYVGAQTVTLSSATSGAKICYTIGSNPGDPATSNTCVVSGYNVSVAASTTIRAIAKADGWTNSTEAKTTYTITEPDVTLKSVTVGTLQGKISGSTITVSPITDIVNVVKVTALANSANAIVSINDGGASKSVTLVEDQAIVNILVTNDGVSRKYQMQLKLASAGSFVDTRNSKSYKAVKIGEQWWMAENLNFEPPHTVVGACYNGDNDSCAKYGKMYTWSEVLDGASPSKAIPSAVQGICPDGWHIPSVGEWDLLKTTVGSEPGNKLKSAAGWEPDRNATGNGTNDFGFNALPAGTSRRFDDSRWVSIHYLSQFHTSTQASTTGFGWYYRLESSSGSVDSWESDDATQRYSLRCVKNP